MLPELFVADGVGESMNSIASEIRYGLPNQKYIEYASRNLLGGNASVDPFAPFVLDKADNIYISRAYVESELIRSGSRIVLGNKGSGVTALVRWLTKEMLYSSRATRYQTLIVNLSPLDNDAQVQQDEPPADRWCRLWTGKRLISRIFDAYWKQMIVEPLYRATLLPHLRRDKEWMLKLHWFYHHYPPCQYQLISDFELLTWLYSTPTYPPFDPHIDDQDVLTALLRFITGVPFNPREVFGKKFRWPYRKVRLIVDFTGNMVAQTASGLTHCIQVLCALSLPQFEFIVFANTNLDKQIRQLHCVKSGDVSIYALPPWNGAELQRILDERIVAYGGEFRDYAGNVTNWADSLPGLVPAVQYHFRQIVIDGALRAYERPTNYDAPIHALKLARGLVAACAGCWEDRYPPPLNAYQLREIIDLYWEEERCDD